MWSQGEETGALVENSSSQQELAVGSASSGRTFALEGVQCRNVTHTFAATVGPTVGPGNQYSNLL